MSPEGQLIKLFAKEIWKDSVTEVQGEDGVYHVTLSVKTVNTDNLARFQDDIDMDVNVEATVEVDDFWEPYAVITLVCTR